MTPSLQNGSDAIREQARQLERTWIDSEAAWHDDARQLFASRMFLQILGEVHRWVGELDECAAQVNAALQRLR